MSRSGWLNWSKERARLWGVDSFEAAQRLLEEPPGGHNSGRRKRAGLPKSDGSFKLWTPLETDEEYSPTARLRVAFPCGGWLVETPGEGKLRRPSRGTMPAAHLELLILPRLDGYHLDELSRSLTTRRRNARLQGARKQAEAIVVELAQVVSTQTLADFFGCKRRVIQKICALP